jgi:hypothetical protein
MVDFGPPPAPFRFPDFRPKPNHAPISKLMVKVKAINRTMDRTEDQSTIAFRCGGPIEAIHSGETGFQVVQIALDPFGVKRHKNGPQGHLIGRLG